MSLWGCLTLEGRDANFSISIHVMPPCRAIAGLNWPFARSRVRAAKVEVMAFNFDRFVENCERFGEAVRRLGGSSPPIRIGPPATKKVVAPSLPSVSGSSTMVTLFGFGSSPAGDRREARFAGRVCARGNVLPYCLHSP